jgi:hypothetical protein
MYLCDICSAAFDEPLMRTVRNGDGQNIWEETDLLCPVCGVENRYRSAASCPDCRGWKFENEILCTDCRKHLFGYLVAFVRTMSPAQRRQLDEWLDGESIEKYK